ncbi:ACP S-malonyltransferase [Peribacillus tepidiphilus]|uniref:ACP S-malonyltransferase n=1 Tax=Peribacillus tepidiphilus TaxID=2652445 RepID=UPI0012910C5F|nr:ACP S-malonyltransferase [Peribacillus tepidiphilus]
MGKIAFVFPGQGSQAVGMGKDLYDSFDDVKAVFEQADARLSESLSKLIFEGPQDQLTLTINAQPALLTTSIALLKRFQQSGIKADFMAGHSLGEYTALVAAGSIPFEDGVFTVRKRGEFMEEAVPNGQGKMAAVLGMDREALKEATDEVTAKGNIVQLANINSPGQIVISGTAQGVLEASELAKTKGAKRVIPLEVSGPFHSILMKPAATKLQEVLDSISIQKALVPVISNVTASPMDEPEEIKQRLLEQLYSPVLWEDSVKRMMELGVDTFIEIGPGKVLAGLIKKIDRKSQVFSVFDEASYQATVTSLKGES